ncbi:hypothetical protein D3C81_632600 [compost metagenome]
MSPAKFTSSLRLNASVALLITSPVIEPLVLPSPICITPAAMVVLPWVRSLSMIQLPALCLKRMPSRCVMPVTAAEKSCDPLPSRVSMEALCLPISRLPSMWEPVNRET